MKTRNLISKKKSANPHWLHAVGRLPVEAIHVCTTLKDVCPTRYETERREVLVSAYDDKCAIVRRKGCRRYVADLKDIVPKYRPADVEVRESREEWDRPPNGAAHRQPPTTNKDSNAK